MMILVTPETLPESVPMRRQRHNELPQNPRSAETGEALKIVLKTVHEVVLWRRAGAATTTTLTGRILGTK